MSGDIHRLPKWARDRIERLENDVARLEKWIGNEVSKYPRENVHVPDPRDLCGYIPTKHRDARFMIGDTGRHFIEFKRTERGVEVYASERLSIEPRSSNVATLRVEPF
jgi:hypothetical protein